MKIMHPLSIIVSGKRLLQASELFALCVSEHGQIKFKTGCVNQN